jgi:cell wall-associated NlpC family hydrolase
MENLKRFSIVLLATPALFIGCSNNKTSSLTPKAPTKQITEIKETNATTMTKKEKLLASAIFGGEISFEEEEKAKVEEKKEEKKVIATQKRVEKQKLIEPTLSAEEEAWLKSEKVEEILRTAKKYLGVKYIWAANGPSAFDCSGFTKYVFKKNGISLPRYSGHQANLGKKIKFENLEKGDLVFFDTAKKFTQTVNHVGIFIGNHKFIHASSGGKKVMITSFKEKKFYKNKFLYARRIVNNGENLVLDTNIKPQSTFFN